MIYRDALRKPAMLVLLSAIACGALGQQPRRVTVLSYNIHHGEGVDGKLDLPRVAGVIKSVNPDVVAVQEVDWKTRRTGGIDQVKELAALTGLYAAYGRTIDHEGGWYGNMILSRAPLNGFVNHPLPFSDGREPRGVMEARVRLPGEGEQPAAEFLFFATHLDVSVQDRLKAAPVLVRLANRIADLPAVLAGDLNALPESAVLKEIEEAWHVAGAGEPHLTTPVNKPARQIDFILFRPAERWRVVEVKVLDEKVASDHRPILAVLELLP